MKSSATIATLLVLFVTACGGSSSETPMPLEPVPHSGPEPQESSTAPEAEEPELEADETQDAETESEQAESEQAEPEQAEPEQAEPEQAEPEQAEPDSE